MDIRRYRWKNGRPWFAPIIVLIGLHAVGPSRAAVAQATPQDSTAALLRSLQHRLDSLERVVAQLRAGQRDTTEAVDELAALRNAALAAAAENEPAPEPGTQASRTSNLQALNPEISATGDVVGSFVSPEAESSSLHAIPREFELSFQAALDPYTRTKIFLTREEEFEIAGVPETGGGGGAEPGGGGFEVEEGYMYWVGLPGGLGAKVGKFRQEFGLYNRWHTHALFEVERPLATATFLGEDGLIQSGVSIALPAFTVGPATQTFIGEVTRGDNDALFDGGGQFSYLGRFQNFWDISPSTYVQLGATGVYGRNDDTGLKSRLFDIDFSFRWTPGGQARYRDLTLKAEWMFAQRDEGIQTLNGQGGYFQANYRVNQRWILGVRADYVNPYADDPNLVQLVPSVSFWQSEYVRIRLQYNMLKPRDGSANQTVLLQFVWAMGPHKHETY